jgi:UDP-N-acetylmuramate: L-alanyl-gamma-D-glutamyl-meso-diaminopimelate ligase
MKLGVHKEELAGCFDGADEVFFFQPPTSAGIWGR